MKTFISILLVGLFCFLGCSGSNDGISTFTGEANPVAPFGIIDTPTPTYEWTPVPGATNYRLLVQDTKQIATIADTNETAIIDEWYTAEEAGCASEDGLCEATPDAEVIGKHEFKVQACENEECGLWSESLNFDFTAMNVPRFTDNGDGTVTDNHTKLMWSKSADLGPSMIWKDAGRFCEAFALAGLSGWRVPSLVSLKSLIDRQQVNPALPPGNPFTDVLPDNYWSSDIDYHHPQYAWAVNIGTGSAELGVWAAAMYDVWCVRDP